mmetsp:Transcript_60416/g.197744  ORF Transcript_60416/g.197744 Transcript_60416/m.197744 type:complete len:233 (-) Transcript_60416:2004-2702(-)
MVTTVFRDGRLQVHQLVESSRLGRVETIPGIEEPLGDGLAIFEVRDGAHGPDLLLHVSSKHLRVQLKSYIFHRERQQDLRHGVGIHVCPSVHAQHPHPDLEEVPDEVLQPPLHLARLRVQIRKRLQVANMLIVHVWREGAIREHVFPVVVEIFRLIMVNSTISIRGACPSLTRQGRVFLGGFILAALLPLLSKRRLNIRACHVIHHQVYHHGHSGTITLCDHVNELLLVPGP